MATPVDTSTRLEVVEQVLVVDADPTSAVLATRPGLGGVGWRDGVPHIVVHMGDQTGCCPFPVGQPGTEYIQPASARGVPVPVAMLRCPPDNLSGNPDEVWVHVPPDESNPYGSWYVDRSTPFPPNTITYERSGPAGAHMVAPSNAATLPATLAALAVLDIAVVGVCPGPVISGVTDGNLPPPDPDNPGGYRQGERTAAELGGIYESGWADPFNTIDPGQEIYLPDVFGGIFEAPFTWSALALLTGAVKPDGRAMAYKWGREPQFFDPVERRDSRWAVPTASDASEFVAFLLDEVVALAGRMGNENQFDIALCLDNTGSFQGVNTTAQRIWLETIAALRADTRDVWVAVSRYEDYNDFSFVFASESPTGRPFVLQYPVAPVASQVDYDAMVVALGIDTPGGGGDGPEAYLEALYQIASGAGFDGNLDGDVTDSGITLEPGFAPPTLSGTPLAPGTGLPLLEVWTPEHIAYWNDTFFLPDLSQGIGYLKPGLSGDVPAFSGRGHAARGTSIVIGQDVRLFVYPDAVR